MIPLAQKYGSDPNGIEGDCSRSVLASLMNFDNVDCVPHFSRDNCDGAEQCKRTKAWLATQGYNIVTIVFTGPMQEILDSMELVNPGIIFMLSGLNEDDLGHVVLCCAGKILHNTSESEIVAPYDDGWYRVEFLVPLWHCLEKK